MIKKFTEFIGENYGNRTPDEIAEIEKLAIKYFGTTKILPPSFSISSLFGKVEPLGAIKSN